jgi:hypothetical protein
MTNRKPGDSAAKQVFEVGLLIEKTIPPREYLDVREGRGCRCCAATTMKVKRTHYRTAA